MLSSLSRLHVSRFTSSVSAFVHRGRKTPIHNIQTSLSALGDRLQSIFSIFIFTIHDSRKNGLLLLRFRRAASDLQSALRFAQRYQLSLIKPIAADCTNHMNDNQINFCLVAGTRRSSTRLNQVEPQQQSTAVASKSPLSPAALTEEQRAAAAAAAEARRLKNERLRAAGRESIDKFQARLTSEEERLMNQLQAAREPVLDHAGTVTANSPAADSPVIAPLADDTSAPLSSDDVIAPLISASEAVGTCPGCSQETGLKLLPCKHGFCFDCVRIMENACPFCPLCRESVPSSVESAQDPPTADEWDVAALQKLRRK